jgi:hypothetical protein
MIRSVLFVFIASVFAATVGRVAHADIAVTKARIGCLDLQTEGNLTGLVAQACNSKESCSYKAPTQEAYKRAGVRARTRTACSEAMEIEYQCGDGRVRTVSVPGDAWNHPPAELTCLVGPAPQEPAPVRRPAAENHSSAPAANLCPAGTFKTTEHHCTCPTGTTHNYHDLFKLYADCRAPKARPICPLEKVFYTPHDDGCACPAGAARVYTDEVGSLHAKCTRPTAAPVTTAFDPVKNGFTFGNPGECTVGPLFTGLGCCTGMSWTSLALYRASILPPASLNDMRQDPKLAAAIDATQKIGVANMASDWGVKWAVGKSDFLDVTQAIDRGTPVPIGLFAPTGILQLSSEHSVVAYGYWVIDGFHKQVLIYDVDQPGDYCALANFMAAPGKERWTEYCNNAEIASNGCDPTVGQCTVDATNQGAYWVGFWNEQSHFLPWAETLGRQ